MSWMLVTAGRTGDEPAWPGTGVAPMHRLRVTAQAQHPPHLDEQAKWALVLHRNMHKIMTLASRYSY